MISLRKTPTATAAVLAILAIAAPSFARGGASQGATNSGARTSRTPTLLPHTYTSPTYDYTPAKLQLYAAGRRGTGGTCALADATA